LPVELTHPPTTPLPAGLDEEQATTTRSAGTIGEKERTRGTHLWKVDIEDEIEYDGCGRK
jgi:hypothetical protein